MRLVHSHQQLAAAVLGLFASTSLTLAQNLVQNGDFDDTTGGNSGHMGGKPSNLSLDNWNAIRLGGSAYSGSTSYALVGTMSDAREDGAGIPSAYGGVPGYPLGNLNLRGTSLPGSPTGGNVVLVSADQSWVKTALTQWVNPTENTGYTLTFDWAAGQQLGFNGNTQTRVPSRGGRSGLRRCASPVPR